MSPEVPEPGRVDASPTLGAHRTDPSTARNEAPVGPQDTIDVEVHSAHAAIVTLRGEHDLSSRPQITVALAVARGCGNVLVDLTGATFIDSSVINALLHSANVLVREGARLEVVVPPDCYSMRSLFEILSVTRLLAMHDTRDAGIASISLAAPPRITVPGLRIRALVHEIDVSLAEVEARRVA
jgi:anti-sigma B factor antagonist